MSINDNGFLGKEIDLWIKKYQTENSELYDFYLDINQFAHKKVFELSIHDDNGQEVIASSLYLRLLSQYQSVLILSEGVWSMKLKLFYVPCWMDCLYYLLYQKMKNI